MKVKCPLPALAEFLINDSSAPEPIPNVLTEQF